MAALPDFRPPAILDLRQVAAGWLEPLLEEEIREWRRELDWDYRPSADLVRRFVRMQALLGYALVAGDQVLGYGYYVNEEHKGLLGDVYVMPEHRMGAGECRLLTALIQTLAATPSIRRVEAQLMLWQDRPDRELPLVGKLRRFRRLFMMVDLVNPLPQPAGKHPAISYRQWQERDQEAAGRLIAAAYRGHIDSEINDQYRSPGGARRFLSNIVQYPGCGSFCQPASMVAAEQSTNNLAGISLSSLVAFDIGHITQICVAPGWRGRKVGLDLLCRSLRELEQAGCRRVSLTVTASNKEAVSLYERLGFRVHREFDAYVWDGLRG